MKSWVVGVGLACAIQSAAAQDMTSYETQQSFDDVIFGLESAILDRGLVVDHVSHVGEMLDRTRADVGSDVKLFARADVYNFCSASLSRKMMEADRMNIAFCPYGIFVAELVTPPGQVVVGHQNFPDGAMQEVQTLLSAIAQEAIEQ
ncbi:DUF302 domain-containing protein [Rhodobacteraceae bacterium F11138]|nr:DUF302 domain-containing protein [Rhodobacteraceae bacterium F11138]